MSLCVTILKSPLFNGVGQVFAKSATRPRRFSNFYHLRHSKTSASVLQTNTSCCIHTTTAYQTREASRTGFDDYEAGWKNFHLEVPEYFNFANVVDDWAKKEKTKERADNPALWWIDDHGNQLQWNFQQLAEYSKKVANLLQTSCGLRHGDRAVVILPRVPEWWLVNIACVRAGVVLSPGTPQLMSKDILHRLRMSGAKCIIADDVIAERVDQVSAQCPDLRVKLLVSETGQTRDGWLDYRQLYREASQHHEVARTRSDEPMQLFFTSGTTGAPKMAEHTHASYGLGHVTTGRYWLDLTSSDMIWNMSDTGWAKSAYSNLFGPWVQGACVFIHHTPKFDAVETLKAVSTYPITTLCLPPAAYHMVVQHDLSKYDLSRVEHSLTGGDALNPEVMNEWKAGTGLTIREGYGQSETCLACGMFRCLDVRPGSMGKPAPGYDLRVIDDKCRELEPGKEGDLAIKVKPHRPVGLFTRYLDDPVRTVNAFRGDYYVMGDRALRDEDGYLWFVGRADDVILSAGYRIGPFEVESALIEHPAVAESAVVSSPDPIRGQVVKAFIILSPSYQDISQREKLVKDIQEHVKKTTAPYKYPRQIEFVEELPKTVSGKIRRVELRTKEWDKTS
ncbi:acyl-coenzyme A synthetase ACSM3, mitochondrial-like isoform X2 [Branchiostoma lanceolatum]|uniref:acyl-coenzyme A synthetase ACSM3, mitochondrial-like isoform X2 n=1 Tax=Branchiostoma lanceolatum TaxID=7740 RepID=UPI003452D28A